ncbi:MAG TPA: hypothetical protein VFA86_10195 [Gammaproteobacteria bacterium]|nr:hypothetical protein [Gammaproteobacteria bacterium]
MRLRTALPLLLAGLFLAGCASQRCGSHHEYEKAQETPPLKAPSGLQVPTPDPSMQIPRVASAKSKSLRMRADGTCLETPPPFKPPAQPKGSQGQQPPGSHPRPRPQRPEVPTVPGTGPGTGPQ